MRMSKERMQSKLNTWIKHVNAGDSKFFFECHAYTGLSKEDFIEELKWLFEDPQDAIVEGHNPYRREVFFYPDGTAHRFIRMYNKYGEVHRVRLEDYDEGKLMIRFNPCHIIGHNVGLCIWDKLDILRSDKERADILQGAATWRENARIWGILK